MFLGVFGECLGVFGCVRVCEHVYVCVFVFCVYILCRIFFCAETFYQCITSPIAPDFIDISITCFFYFHFFILLIYQQHTSALA
jgi:hypothetical protein